MSQTNAAYKKIFEFNRRNSRTGLFKRYVYSRKKGAASRILFVVLGSVVIGALIGANFGVLTLGFGLVGEVIDLLYMAYLSQHKGRTYTSRTYYRLAILTSGFQAIGISVCVLIAWHFGGHEARFFALAFLAGTLINAGLILNLHRQAIQAKLAIYALSIVLLAIYEIHYTSDWSRSLLFDVFGALNLGIMLMILFSYIRGHETKRYKFERSLLEQYKHSEHLIKELEASEKETKQLALIAQSATDSIVITDENSNISWVNPAFTNMTGYSSEEAIGHNPGALLNGPSTSRDAVNAIIKGTSAKREIRVEIQNHHKNGTPIWIETNIKPIFDEDGRFLMNLSVERDITQSKAQATKLEAALTEAQSAAESKSKFLATMSHEIRTPMNGIIGMADLLITTKLNKTQKDYVNIISQSGDGLLQIINDILDFSKLDAGNMDIEMHPFDPRETFANVQNLMCPIASEKGLNLLLVYETDLPAMLKGDAGRIRQILLNLLGNSIKFTAQGKIEIAISHHQIGSNIELVITVSDTGIGIPKGRLDTIFEEFSQAEEDTSRRFGGTGLGLSISRLLAQNMGGDISVTSEVGKGSVFKVVLKVEAAEKTKPIVETPSKELSLDFLAGKTILIAEDNKTNRFLIRKMLTDTDAEIVFAKDGVQAVEMFQTIAPDLVLMDISMPHKDGKQATVEIRDFEQGGVRRPVPIIALTANAFKEDRDACFEAGMDGFLTKPIRRAVLNAEISRIWKITSKAPENIDV